MANMNAQGSLRWGRLSLALAVSPLVPVLVFCGLRTVSGNSGDLIIPALIALTIGYPGELIFGLPLLLFFRRRNVTGFIPFVLSAAIIGLLGASLVALPDIIIRGVSPAFAFSPIAKKAVPLMFYSGLAGATFWCVLRPKRSA